MSRQTEEESIEKLTDDSSEASASIDENRLSMDHPEKQSLMPQSEEMTTPEESDTPQNSKMKSLIVHILVMTFGSSAWIGVNGIFIQLPLLVNSSPEKWGLAAYLVITVQSANIAPIVYGLFRKSSCSAKDSHCIYGMLGVASIVMGLLVFLYNKTSIIAGHEHSTSLIVLTFFTAAVSCTSSVLFMPYLKNFKDIYLVSYFIGEGLSGVVPSIVALIQGIDESPKCNNVTETSTARFSSQSYFSFLCSCLILSLVAFFLLENLSFIKEEKVSVLSEGSNSDNERHIDVDEYKKTEVGETSNVSFTQTRQQLSMNNLYLYILLSVICLLANGFLPSLQPYSCLSYGNMTYHLSATFSQIVNPAACLIGLWYLPLNKVMINILSSIIFIVSGYIIYLALVSPNPPLKNSNFGEALVILSWILLVGLISYVKLMITSVFRRKSEQTLFHVGVAMQVGSACGAVLSFVLINYTNLLKEYDPCNHANN